MWLIGIAGLTACTASVKHTAVAQAGLADNEQTLVTVNGEPITRQDLEIAFLARNVPPAAQADAERPMLEELVDRRLIAQFLQKRRITVPPLAISSQLDRLEALLRDQGKDPKEVWQRLGVTPAMLKQAVELPIAWRKYVDTVVAPEKLRAYYLAHKSQFDGTEVRASQILRKVAESASEQEVEAARELLVDLKRRIAAGQLAFADAAKQHSQAPTAEAGGDVGFFALQGKLPGEVAKAAFELKKGEVSDPVRSPFGWHLLQVTDRRVGQLSLEDARPQVMRQLSGELWQATVERQKQTAKIVWR